MTMTHTANEIVLVVVNDGNGRQCGMTYGERCAHARAGRWDAFKRAARNYGRYVNATSADVDAAAIELADYYRQHISEVRS